MDTLGNINDLISGKSEIKGKLSVGLDSSMMIKAGVIVIITITLSIFLVMVLKKI